MKRCIIILKWRKCTMNLSIRVEIFKEDDVYVALSPELNVSSFGETIFEAKESIKEAIELFL
jgi:predicted RNase H-like HicB family nuclease